jgi:tetratricopeptide (TPR) repeat protein
MCCGCSKVVTRDTSLTPEEQNRNDRLDALAVQAEAAVRRKDYSSAEADVRRQIAIEPGALVYQEGLGNVLLLEGDREGARVAYKKCVDSPNVGIGDSGFLMQYGELAYSAGQFDDAKGAYLRAWKIGHFFPRTITDRPAGFQSLAELRAAAWAKAANFYRGQPETYLRLTDQAVAIDPQAMYPRLAHADALYVNGRWADSRKEFDLAKRLDPERAAAIEQFIKRFYYFDRYNHGTAATVGPGGKVTFRRYRRPLPNNLPHAHDSVLPKDRQTPPGFWPNMSEQTAQPRP